MKIVTSVLKEKQLNFKDLPESIQERIVGLKELTDAYNDAFDDYEEQAEEDKETEDKLDKMEHFIAETDKELAAAIKALSEVKQEEPKQEPEPQPESQPEPKKKDSSVGWLIFGGIALVVTLGAVNILKRR